MSFPSGRSSLISDPSRMAICVKHPLIKLLPGKSISYRRRFMLPVELFKAGIVSQAFIFDTMTWACWGRHGTTAMEVLTIDASLNLQGLDLYLQAIQAHPMGGWFCSFLHYLITPGTDLLGSVNGLDFFDDRDMFIGLVHEIS